MKSSDLIRAIRQLIVDYRLDDPEIHVGNHTVKQVRTNKHGTALILDLEQKDFRSSMRGLKL